MIASHDSYSFLPPRRGWLRLFSWLWRTQGLNIEEQARAGVRYFDVRVRREGGTGLWRVCHGVVDFPVAFFSLEEIAGRFAPYLVRILLERGSREDEEAFAREAASLWGGGEAPARNQDPANPFMGNIDMMGVKKGWRVLYEREPRPYVIDHYYRPWDSGMGFWENLRRLRLSTIRRWARGHRPTALELRAQAEGRGEVHFYDFIGLE